VADNRAAAELGNPVSGQLETLAARDRAADDRQFAADQRQGLADERDRQADEREREASRREAQADERDHRADEREWSLDETARKIGQPPDAREQSHLEAIARARGLLALSGQRLDRQQEGAARARALQDRQHAAADRASVAAEQDLAAWLPDPGTLIERGEAQRQRAVTAVQAFAGIQDQVARLHEELAARHPARREEYRRTAEEARKMAHKARGFLRDLARLTAN
jgi:hypothetical protein